MSELPSRTISPSEYLEHWLPRAFAEAGLPPGSAGLDVSCSFTEWYRRAGLPCWKSVRPQPRIKSASPVKAIDSSSST